jgi:hypothetical protein
MTQVKFIYTMCKLELKHGFCTLEYYIKIGRNTYADGKATLLLQRSIYHCWGTGVRSCSHRSSAVHTSRRTALSESRRSSNSGNKREKLWNCLYRRSYEVAWIKTNACIYKELTVTSVRTQLPQFKWTRKFVWSRLYRVFEWLVPKRVPKFVWNRVLFSRKWCHASISRVA